MHGRRVVVTGLGMVSPLGTDVESSWAAILEGKSGIAPIQNFDTSALPVHFGGQVDDFDTEQWLPARDARRMDPFIHYAAAAASQAWQDAGIEITRDNAGRSGAIVGSGIGGLGSIEKNTLLLHREGARRISPFFVPGSIINMAAGYLAVRYGLQGVNLATVTACASGMHAIAVSARLIAAGDAELMLAGGAECAITPLGVAGFAAARALSTRNEAPAEASRPWDRERDGFVLGDGAGILVLEEYETARARGARMYGELLGVGQSADAFHITAPPEDGHGAVEAMLNALRDAQLDAAEVQYVNAHGTSTLAGDLAETRALQQVFGGAVSKLAVSSTKSMIGHLLGAAGAVEAIFCLLAIRDQVAPPTINLQNPGEGCTLDYVAEGARQMPIDAVLSNSFGFGGTNGSLLFRRLH